MSSCFRQYLNAAKSYYTADTADQSIMVLTLIRMWMAIDELAMKDCSMLRGFSPELPVNILDPLLLNATQHLEQAQHIQQHIRARHNGASGSNPSIFSDTATSSCFAVRFFRSSSRHQQIKRNIETHAQEQKRQKIQELANQNARYEQLGREIRGMSCNYYYSNGWRNHCRWCSLCSKTQERNNLNIRPYEWPLPRYQLDAEAAVFELERPESFSIWRDITYEILVDLGTASSRSRCEKYSILEEYDALSLWLSNPSSSPRITIASSTKSFMQSHYSGTISIPSTESQVCLDNALGFKLYDRNKETWASGSFPGVSFAKFGTLKLPANGLYQHLEYAMEKTTHTSNQVLADQYDCPRELSLHEHIAFGTLRSGARLQWMNIVRGLEEDLLTFTSDKVWLIHTQAAWQIGPLSDDGSREWHEDLGQLEFGQLVVSQCQRMLGRIKAN
ncbi:unnamed protein product [Rhizoctonia solani]|uniref:Uncharacterized protein n=1 Tax=Rhizoctonia solani TaxID=456999 RepID=A0A8H3D437_9AGAM|nr:unnamed protein product [Rhizoctonia solani]